LKTTEVVSFPQNTLLAQKYIEIHVQNYKNSKIFRKIISGPASTGREIRDGRGQDGKGKRRGEGMKGRKWNGREGRREGSDIRGEKGEEIGGTRWKGGWGEGCAHRYRGCRRTSSLSFEIHTTVFGKELIR
jgi:hypothetical protein